MSLSTSRLSLQEAKTPGAASAPDSRAPRPQAGPVPGTHRPFHERVTRTKRPPTPPAPRAAQLSRDLTGTSRRTSLFLRDTLASHQPPGPRPQVPLPDGIIFAGALVVRVRRAGRAGAEGGPPQASGRGCGGPGLLCPAGTRSGVHGRARPGREPQSAAGLRGARLWPGRRGSPTPPTPPATVARQPRALLSSRARAAAQTLPGRCPAPSGGGLRTGTGTPSWENSWGPAHTLRTFAEREGALTGTQGPRQARSRGTAASSLGFYSNVRPETTQRLQANPLTSVLAAYVQVPRLTGQWKQNTK